MENYHDIIQWLLPLREPSQYNPHAPLLTEEDVTAFRTDVTLRDHLLRSLDRFLEFVGLERQDERIDPSRAFEQKRELWTRPNHNWLRITHILHGLRMLGLEEQGRQLFSSLEHLDQRGEARISRSTLAYRKNATYPRSPVEPRVDRPLNSSRRPDSPHGLCCANPSGGLSVAPHV